MIDLLGLGAVEESELASTSKGISRTKRLSELAKGYLDILKVSLKYPV